MYHNFLKVMFTVVLFIVAGCDSSNELSKAANSDTETNVVSENIDQSKDLSGDATIPSTDNEAEKQNEDVDPNPTDVQESEDDKNLSDLKIESGEEAFQFLKQQLKEGSNEDVSFGTDGKLESDNKGSYYMVQLVDIPLRVSGKTGTLGYYKVYQDGTYELFQLNSNNPDSGKVINKEYYLQKLNDIKKETEDKLKGVMTSEMVEQVQEDIYKTWDVELNEIYGVLKDQLSKEQMDKLREEQRSWITHRDEAAKEASEKHKGGSMESIEYVATQATLTKQRCYELVENYLN